MTGLDQAVTRIRLLANNVIVPDRALAPVPNYDLPEPRMALLILLEPRSCDSSQVSAIAR